MLQLNNSVERAGKYQFFIILECLIWGVGNPLTKFVYLEMTPFCYMAVRFMLSFLVFVLFFHSHMRDDLSFEKLKNCAIVGVCMGATYIFANLAFKTAMVTVAGFLMGISVIFTSLIAVIFFRTRLSKIFTIAIIAVIVGMYLLCCGGTGDFAFGIGEFFALMSSVCMALTLLTSAKFIKDVSPFTLSAVQCLVTAVICFVFGLILEDFSCVLTKDITAWVILIYLALGCTVAAFILQNISIKHLSAIFVSLAFCTEPIFTAVASFFILGERIKFMGIVGSILIVIGVAIASVINEKAQEEISE